MVMPYNPFYSLSLLTFYCLLAILSALVNYQKASEARSLFSGVIALQVGEDLRGGKDDKS